MFGQVGTICVPTLFFLFTAMTCHPAGAASQATLGSHYHDLPLGSHYQHPLPVQPILGRMSDVFFDYCSYYELCSMWNFLIC